VLWVVHLEMTARNYKIPVMLGTSCNRHSDGMQIPNTQLSLSRYQRIPLSEYSAEKYSP
jgi:hypothetical protein